MKRYLTGVLMNYFTLLTTARHSCTALLCACFLVPIAPTLAADRTGEADHWWPVQAMPKSLVRLEQRGFPSPYGSSAMTAQSVAGLAAKAVNERRGDEMVWIDTGDVVLERWFALLLARHRDLQVKGAVALWDLIDTYTRLGIIKGYILYKADKSEGNFNQHRAGIDCSVNVATSLAGILDGIIVDENLQHEAEAHGLKMLIDVRGKTEAWCFETYKDRFNRRMACTQDPRKPHTRDLAIAQRTFAMYGSGEPILSVMKWLEPLSPILGWNGGDEFKTTELSSRWGHIQTATDWCSNLPVLMAGSESGDHPKRLSTDAPAIDWGDQRSAVSFINSDGDNVQWFENGFFRSGNGAHYWGSPDRGKIPFGWSCCFAHLAQLCPEAVDYAWSTRSPHDTLIEWGGGYYYPDLFGMDRPNRWELLAKHARRTWAMMEKTGTRMIGFNLADYRSPEARKAYEVFAGQTDGLLAILVFQYSPYEAGAGETFWVTDRSGIELPVVTVRYSIWENSNNRERSGTPAKVAREIAQTVEQTPLEKLPRNDWVIGHVWSYFKQSAGTDENAENMRQETAAVKGGIRGYAPALWCAERLPANIRVVSPEEMAWRIRMQHNPAQTNTLIHHHG
jgi:hypothetical protein